GAWPFGGFGDLWFSSAMGENSPSRGADLALYFCARVCLMNDSRSCLNFGSPGSPAHDSLYPKKAKITSAFVPTFSKRFGLTTLLSAMSCGLGTGALAESHWSAVPKSSDRSRLLKSGLAV